MAVNLAKRKKEMYGWMRQKQVPYQFYQFWLNATDEDAEKWIRIFTFLGKDEIAALSAEHSRDPGSRVLQKKLAEEVTGFVHGSEELETAIATTAKLFSNQAQSAEELSAIDLEEMEGVVKFNFSGEKIKSGIDVVSFLAESGSFASKGEARKMIQNGGVSLNRKKVEDAAMMVNDSHLLHEKYILIQKGKKNYYLVTN